MPAPTLFDDLAFAGSSSTSSSAEGDTRGSGVRPLAPAPGVASNVRPSDPDTSHAAAGAVMREHLTGIVVRLLTEYPDGLSDWELYRLSGVPEHLRGSLIKRRGECGAVDSGRRNWSPSGRKVAVWALPGVEA